MAIAKVLDLKIEDIVDRHEYERLTAAKSKSTVDILPSLSSYRGYSEGFQLSRNGSKPILRC